MRLVVVGSRGADMPRSANPLGADWSRIPTDSIYLELQYFGFPGSPPVDGETVFPLDWSNARAGGMQGDFNVSRLAFQHLLQPLTLVAYVGKDAPAADIAEIRAVVSSLRPEPIPAQGAYRGWTVVGRADALPIGAVSHFESIAFPNADGFFVVRGAKTLFAYVDHAYVMFGATRPCAIKYESASRTFVCDATDDRWSRVGKLLTAGDGWAVARLVVDSHSEMRPPSSTTRHRRSCRPARSIVGRSSIATRSSRAPHQRHDPQRNSLRPTRS